MVLTAIPASEKYKDVNGTSVCLLTYQHMDDYWLLLKMFQCSLCWAIPSIVGLPSGCLLILGVAPDSIEITQFNVLEVRVKGKHTECVFMLLICMHVTNIILGQTCIIYHLLVYIHTVIKFPLTLLRW